MPELPEVERARALLERAALGRRITAVDDSDEWVCRPHSPGEIAGALEGATLASAHRRGKAMWVETDRDAVLGLHLAWPDDSSSTTTRRATRRGASRTATRGAGTASR